MKDSNNYIEILQNLGVKKRYDKDEIIFYEGERANKFFLLLSGSVRIYKSLELGSEKTLHIFKAPCFIAEMPSFNNALYPASSVCEETCEILSIESSAFKKELENTQFCLTFIASLFSKIRILESCIEANNQSLSERFLHFARENKATLSTLTQRKIAQMLNTSAESLSRVLKELKKDNKITITKGKISLV
ncbi:cyclic nucleotide-binding domain-containing protein [Helicobacter saguini]|uniref:Crp/Fnr family transcriptional regulator n=1 Tax=Helicobacter saguini TaxID=1548018 RepID=A0A347VTL6_9HELI|nr:Crp/Fnr family transcriptional regulator [Helicobacter saguini]MWV62046.1 cyclic nucleotide-binding domain-containing protein [Helicobacter saguini]MWV67281.1 cyclic nucleotide-binding domain-containing protein [Helicobacter saguini]MWV69634.1 cyclic nucleotide-binding domain-containing protein [Helicobacter saguini]MWV70815.1 cyclic nucleotide-binding domain-containing protein [Helicobacter saguini]TLD94344.1 Crp/Fnr family transcriptional regulator [Helicobacter saguini]